MNSFFEFTIHIASHHFIRMLLLFFRFIIPFNIILYIIYSYHSISNLFLILDWIELNLFIIYYSLYLILS